MLGLPSEVATIGQALKRIIPCSTIKSILKQTRQT